ncbi:MAG: Gfo/Idh/MocA family oxidoreductase [Bacteroidota bacterium]
MNKRLDRRSFIGKAGVIMGGATLATVGSIPVASCNRQPIPLKVPGDKIRLGVIGTGQRYVEQIVPALTYLPNFEVIACADPIPLRLENGLKHSAPGAKGYKDYRNLLENRDVDAVVVCTPLKFHYQIASDALTTGMHVTCEKPMTYSIEEAIELEKIVHTHKELAFRVPYEYRKDPVHTKVRHLIREGLLGKITHVDAKWDSFNDWRREVIDPDFAGLINWRLYRKYCGGLMTEVLSHQIDLVQYMLDLHHPIKVISSGSIRYWRDERDTFDNVQTILEYPDDLHATFSANRASQYEGAVIKIYGEKATVEIHFGGIHTATITPNSRLADSGKDVDAVTGASIKILKKSDQKKIVIEEDTFTSYHGKLYGFNIGTMFGYAHFAEMIVNGAAPDISATDGKNAAISAHMANLSNRSNTIEYWKPEYGA